MTRLTGVVFRSTMELFMRRLEARRDVLNSINVYPVSDGDTGDNLFYTMDSALGELAGAGSSMSEVGEAIAHGALHGARGSSGVIMSEALRGFIDGLGGGSGAGDVAEALTRAASRAYAAIWDPTEGTMLTVARDAAARAKAADSGSLSEVVLEAVTEGHNSLARTPDLLPILREAGVVDAGGLGYVLFLEALAEAVTGVVVEPFEVAIPVAGGHRATLDEMTTRYEVICLIESDDSRIQDLRERWGAIGNTVAIVGTGDAWKCHVHTHAVEEALNCANDAGEVTDMEITDLLEQVDRDESFGSLGRAEAATRLVAVAEGTALVALLLEAGAERVVVGGFTSKPATGDLLRTVEACRGPVVLLPGSKDVIPAARQVIEHADKEVLMVPTTGVLTDLFAVECFDPADDATTNAARMSEQVDRVRWADVKQVAWDADTPIGHVHEGQWLAIGTGGGIAVDDDPVRVLEAAARALVTEHSTVAILSIDSEAPVDADSAEALERNHPGVEWRTLRGGRPGTAFGLAILDGEI